MNRRIPLIMLCISFFFPLSAQINQGARLTAMGKSGTAVRDIWGVGANPASISTTSSPTLQLSHQGHFLSKEIKNQALAVTFPAKNLVLGLSLQHYGITAFRDNKLGIVISRSFGPNLTIGLRANYHQLKITNYGTTSGVSVDVGTIYQLTDQLGVGFYINNLSKERYATKAIHISLPTPNYFGIAYRASDKLLIAGTISKDLVSTGMDYQLHKRLSIRSGLSLHPFTYHLGIGFTTSEFIIDLAFIKPVHFSYSPMLTIGYDF